MQSEEKKYRYAKPAREMPRSLQSVPKLLILTVLIEIIGKMSFGVKEMLGHEGQQVLVISGGFGEGMARNPPSSTGKVSAHGN